MSRIGFLCLILGLFAGCVTEKEKTEIKRPEKFFSGYFGYFVGTNKVHETEQMYLKPMKDAGFNTVEIKIQQYNKAARRFDSKKSFQEVKELAETVKRNGLFLEVYFYPEPYDGKRNTKDWANHEKLPFFVDETGKAIPERFSLIHWEVWRDIFDNAFQFAKLSRELPIGAVKLDIETISNMGISYDDKSWRLFCSEHSSLDPNLTAASRHNALEKSSLTDTYSKWFIGKFEEIVVRFEKEMHMINPHLLLGIMPTTHGWFSAAFMKRLATVKTPAIMDDWCMYNGSGFTENVTKRQNEIKKFNSNNIFIPWFRVNNYMPSELATQAYCAASSCDGYSNWTMSMLSPGKKNNTYALPGNCLPGEYYTAYKKANDAVMLDMKDGTLGMAKRIPYKKVIPLVPPLNTAGLNFPELVPYGSGKGEPQAFILRDQQTVFIYAESGESIKVLLKHLAGQKRPISLQYALLDNKKNILRNESISPGAEERFQVTAPYSGLYALVVSGGADGMAWYGVKVFNKYAAYDARKGLYFFFTDMTKSIKTYLYRKGKGNANLKIKTRPQEAYSYSLNGKEVCDVAEPEYKIEIPLTQDGIEVMIGLPTKQIKGTYTQDLTFFPEGALAPFIYDGPERKLVPAKNK